MVSDHVQSVGQWPLSGGSSKAVHATGSTGFRTQIQHCVGNAGEFNRAVIALKTIVQTEGLVGLFAGYRSFLLRDLPFDAIEFFAYEQLKVTYSKSLKDRRPLNPAETSVIGERALSAITGCMLLHGALLTLMSCGCWADRHLNVTCLKGAHSSSGTGSRLRKSISSLGINLTLSSFSSRSTYAHDDG